MRSILLTVGEGFHSGDGEVMYRTTWSLVDNRTLAIPCDKLFPQGVRGADGGCYSKHGMDQPLAAMPLYIAGTVWSNLAKTNRWDTTHFFVSRLNQIVTAITVASERLYASAKTGVCLAFVYGLGTIAWPYSNNGIVAYNCRVRFTPGTRTIELAMVWFGRKCIGLCSYHPGHSCYHFAFVFPIISVSGIFWILVTLAKAGQHCFTSGYSPGKSIFLFAPPVILAPWGLARLWAEMLFGGVFLLYLLFHAKWWTWHGGWSWGPRFLVLSIPFLVLDFGPLCARGKVAQSLLIALFIIGLYPQLNDEFKILFQPRFSPLIGHPQFLPLTGKLALAGSEFTKLGLPCAVSALFRMTMLGALIVLGWMVYRREFAHA
ncbi:MAG: hypothetical protein NZ653_09515 [Anaerolineae bacterium]|nr:hypothetical protein [Anaerolineae bacterium]